MLNRKNIYITLIFFVIGNSILMIILNSYSSKIVKEQVSQVYATTHIQLKITSAHLWFEELLTGDKSVSFETILESFDDAKWYANALIKGGVKKDKYVKKVKDEKSLRLLEEIDIQIKDLEKITHQRYNDDTAEKDVKYNAIFNKIILETKNLESRLNKIILQNQKNSDNLNLLILTISWVISMGVVYILYILEKIIKEEAKKREDKEEELREYTKMLSISELMINLTHQWRQPLSIISTVASGIGLKIEFKSFDEKELLSELQQIVDTTSTLSKTLDKIGNFTNSSCEFSFTNIENIFNNSQALLRNEIKENNIKITLDFNGDDIRICENELVKVLITILDNAIFAVSKNSLENRFIFLSADIKESQLIVKIRDNGGGIDDSLLPKIFEPYFTTKHKSQGTGLGLYIAKEIITRNLSGNIKVKNINFTYNDIEQKGCEFTLNLPIQERFTHE